MCQEKCKFSINFCGFPPIGKALQIDEKQAGSRWPGLFLFHSWYCVAIPSSAQWRNDPIKPVHALAGRPVIGKLIHPPKGKSTHSLSISPFFPDLFSFSGFMKNRLSHYNYSFPNFTGRDFPSFFLLFLSFFSYHFLPFSFLVSRYSLILSRINRMKQTRLLWGFARPYKALFSSISQFSLFSLKNGETARNGMRNKRNS